jgi:hypothetical protein
MLQTAVLDTANQSRRDCGSECPPGPRCRQDNADGDGRPQAQARRSFLAAAGLASSYERQSASGEGERDNVGQERKDLPEAEQEPTQRTAHQDDHMSPGFAAGQGRHQLRWFHQGTGEASLSQFREDREALLDGGQGHQPDN